MAFRGQIFGSDPWVFSSPPPPPGLYHSDYYYYYLFAVGSYTPCEDL